MKFSKLISPVLLTGMCVSSIAQAGIANISTDHRSWQRAVFASGSTPTRPAFFNIPRSFQLTEGVENDVGNFSVYYASRDGANTPGTALVDSNVTNGGAEGFQVNDYLALNIVGGGPNRTETIELRFDEGISAFSADFGFIHASSGVALTADGESIDLFSAIDGSGRFASGFLGLEFDNLISSLSFSVSTSSDEIWLDNIRLATPSAVPVPAAAWLFGSALLGLFGVRRKV